MLKHWTIALIIALCPPPLTSFSVSRTDLGGGWVHTVGEQLTKTRHLQVNYEDNRNYPTNRFQSRGTVRFINLAEGNRRIKYQHRVQIPKGNYLITQNKTDYSVCASDGLVIMQIPALVFSLAVDKSWDYTVDIDLWGDVNNDGVIDGADIGLLMGDWGTDNIQSDFNNDGIVDAMDLGLLLENW
tara:strand:- start:3601 stop:4155 length:555 start_codon:yes stop_codon:yes gene_type:complete